MRPRVRAAGAVGKARDRVVAQRQAKPRRIADGEEALAVMRRRADEQVVEGRPPVARVARGIRRQLLQHDVRRRRGDLEAGGGGDRAQRIVRHHADMRCLRQRGDLARVSRDLQDHETVHEMGFDAFDAQGTGLSLKDPA